MEKLKILLVMLVSAASGLAVSGYILALILTPRSHRYKCSHSCSQTVSRPPFHSWYYFSSLLFLSTVLASMVGVIYFLVLPEMKNYYITSGNEKENNVSIVLKTLKPEERG